MKLEVKGKLWDRLLETKAGRFASLLDKLVYDASEDEEKHWEPKLVLPMRFYDKNPNAKDQHTMQLLQDLRDYLYQKGLEEVAE